MERWEVYEALGQLLWCLVYLALIVALVLLAGLSLVATGH